MTIVNSALPLALSMLSKHLHTLQAFKHALARQNFKFSRKRFLVM